MTWARRASPVPNNDRFSRERMIAKAHNDIQNSRAARIVASHADDVHDCADLLEMLGLNALDGKRSREV